MTGTWLADALAATPRDRDGRIVGIPTGATWGPWGQRLLARQVERETVDDLIATEAAVTLAELGDISPEQARAAGAAIRSGATIPGASPAWRAL